MSEDEKKEIDPIIIEELHKFASLVAIFAEEWVGSKKLGVSRHFGVLGKF